MKCCPLVDSNAEDWNRGYQLQLLVDMFQLLPRHYGDVQKNKIKINVDSFASEIYEECIANNTVLLYHACLE